MIGVGGTAPAAVKLCPTGFAAFVFKYIAVGERLAYVLPSDAVPDVSQQIFAVTYELVAGVQVTKGGDGYIFCA